MYIVYLEKVMDNSIIYYGYFEKEEDAKKFCEKMNACVKYLTLPSVLYRYTYDKVDPLDGVVIIPLLNIDVCINKNISNARINAYIKCGDENLLLIDETQLTQDDVMVHQIPGVYSFEFYVKLDTTKKLDEYTEELENKAKELSVRLLGYEPKTATVEYSV